MSKQKSTPHKQGKSAQKAVPAPTRSRLETAPYKVTRSILVALCTVLGALVAALTLLPRVTVSPPSAPFDPNNTLSVSFDITNANFVALRNVDAILAVGQIVTKATTGFPQAPQGFVAEFNPSFIPTFASRLVHPEWQHHQLGMDEKFTITLDMIRADVTDADIAIVVSYEPWLLPIRREKIFRFIGHRRSSNALYWRSWPLGEPPPQF